MGMLLPIERNHEAARGVVGPVRQLNAAKGVARPDNLDLSSLCSVKTITVRKHHCGHAGAHALHARYRYHVTITHRAIICYDPSTEVHGKPRRLAAWAVSCEYLVPVGRSVGDECHHGLLARGQRKTKRTTSLRAVPVTVPNAHRRGRQRSPEAKSQADGETCHLLYAVL